MLRHVLRRLLYTIPVFLGVVTVVFLVVRVLPGDPAAAALGDNASKEAVDTLRERMGLNAPLLLQYIRYLGQLVSGDLGRSMITGTSIKDEVLHNLPYTFKLTLASGAIGLLVGVPVGVVAAVRRNRWFDYVSRIVSLTGLSVPAYAFGILLALLFAIKLGWLPAVGGGDPLKPGDTLRYLVLPAVTLGLVMAAAISRLSRSAMLGVLGQDYIRTARAKGLAGQVVTVRHGLRTALIPIISLTGIWAIALIGDSVTTEIVFARPGLGKMIVGAMLQRDYTALQSVMVVYTIFVVLINLLTDLAYSVADPRGRG